MKCAIISDLHFGDPGCSLVVPDKKNKKKYMINQHYYTKLKDAIGTNNDYLVLLGDVFDFAIKSYSEVYEIAEKFFKQVKDDKLANEIIYIPGNHDFNMWHTVEHEVNTINRFKESQPPRPFHFSVPAIIDDRKKSSMKGFTLSGVTRHKKKKNESGYGGLFLDYITVHADPKKKDYPEKVKKQRTVFNIAYPNLYIVTDKEFVLVTHGHYFEKVWSILGVLLPYLASDDPVVGKKLKELDLKDLVSVNFPQCQLTSSGIGQAGIFTYLAGKIEEDVKSGRMSLTEKFLKRAAAYFLRKTGSRKWYHALLDFVSKIIINRAIKIMVKKIKSEEHTSLDVILNDKSSKNRKQRAAALDRIHLFLRAARHEIQQVLKINRFPDTIIFGHTHKPVPLGVQNPPVAESDSYAIPMYNTGGWLAEPHGDEMIFCGAAIFIYETGKELRSVSVE